MEVLKKIMRLPAEILSGIFFIFFGSYEKEKHPPHAIKTDVAGNEEVNRGLILWILDAVKYVFLGISNAVSNHRDAIATAFWSSLVLAGAAALTLGLWPAALAAVTGFSIYGYSIAMLVGAGFVPQLAACAGLAAIATSAVTYLCAFVVNMVIAIKDAVEECQQPTGETNSFDSSYKQDGMQRVMASSPTNSPSKQSEPQHHHSPAQRRPQGENVLNLDGPENTAGLPGPQ